MLIKYTLNEELTIPPEETGKIEESTLVRLHNKYLMKVSAMGLCIAVTNIRYRNNVVLRESADVLVQLTVDVLCVQLSQGEYFEGVVRDINEKGIKIEFMGILEGTLRANCMHPNTRYDPDNNRWLFLQGTGEAYVWRTDAKAFFKIHKASWHLAKQESNLSDLVLLRADESGLGPEEWWS